MEVGAEGAERAGVAVATAIAIVAAIGGWMFLDWGNGGDASLCHFGTVDNNEQAQSIKQGGWGCVF